MEKLIALLGKPVASSLSPTMQNAAFSALGLRLRYMAFEVEDEKLADAVAGLRALGFSGANVTIPHKTRVMKLLDEVDPLSRDIGAVNTISVSAGGRLKGYNTDAEGLLLALEATDPRGLSALVLGAGGASRGACHALARGGIKEIVICNRTASRAQELTDSLARAHPSLKTLTLPLPDPLGRDAVAGLVREYSPDILVGTVPSSAYVDHVEEASPLAEAELTVCDLAYSKPPSETPLIRIGMQLGARTVTGLSVLLHQGARAFEIWTGLRAPIGVMKRALWGPEGG